MLEEGEVETQADPNLLSCYREKISVNRELITQIFKDTDPASYELFQMLYNPSRAYVELNWGMFFEHLKLVWRKWMNC
jgi:hypothetical protein